MHIYPKIPKQKTEELQTVSDVFKRGTLKMLVQKSQQINTMNALLQDILPREFQALCILINIKNNRLIIKVPDAAIATRLKFESMDLVTQLRKKASWVAGVEFKVGV